MTNFIVQTGKVVRAPEVKHFQSDAKLVTFSISVSNGTDTQGNWKPSNWWDVKAWNYAAQGVHTLQEGQYVEVVGKIVTEEWDDRDNPGKKKSKKVLDAQKIVLVKYLPRDEDTQTRSAQQPAATPNTQAAEPNYDDIPF